MFADTSPGWAVALVAIGGVVGFIGSYLTTRQQNKHSDSVQWNKDARKTGAGIVKYADAFIDQAYEVRLHGATAMPDPEPLSSLAAMMELTGKAKSVAAAYNCWRDAIAVRTGLDGHLDDTGDLIARMITGRDAFVACLRGDLGLPPLERPTG